MHFHSNIYTNRLVAFGYDDVSVMYDELAVGFGPVYTDEVAKYFDDIIRGGDFSKSQLQSVTLWHEYINESCRRVSTGGGQWF